LFENFEFIYKNRYIEQNQDKIRATSKQELENYVEQLTDPNQPNPPDKTGHVILPKSFVGGIKYHYSNYLDAMTVVSKFGKPDLFITLTCNPGMYHICFVLVVYFFFYFLNFCWGLHKFQSRLA